MSWLREATTADGDVVDVEIADGVIRRVIRHPSITRPAPGTASPGGASDHTAAEDVDLRGQVLLPSFVEPHAHLDKALTAALAPNGTGDLLGAIAAIQTLMPHATVADIAARAQAALRIGLALGTTHVRTHVNVGGPAGMRALEALIDVRERWRGLVELQLVALVSNPLSGQPGRDLRRALAEGADVAGGCPHLDPEPERAVAICLDAAGDAGCPIDLHTDETLDPRLLTLATLAELVMRTGFGHGAAASHCVSLGMQPLDVQARISEQVAAAGVGVVTLPQTNLYLQGRGHPVGTPRGLTAIAALRRAGVTVAAGGDNLRDPFNPVGRGDALETASLLVTAGHLDASDALSCVSAAPRRLLGLPPVTLTPGSPADLVALPGSDALSALAAADVARTVWRGGRIVARTHLRRVLVEPGGIEPGGIEPGDVEPGDVEPGRGVEPRGHARLVPAAAVTCPPPRPRPWEAAS
ncbi:cytosine/creatinine deaminase [Frankia sp. AiPs1]|uniref:amidohydrolase family protein n=1 Tax=Frankia sp. AiPa1 TaxID=573492 RepID=UPI00202B437B|nr:amidohydrolase family protein [Frankia sp. AiPa1]MCL9759668.1 amidohydrolase family protein [Frankia sp. AiPa1]